MISTEIFTEFFFLSLHFFLHNAYWWWHIAWEQYTDDDAESDQISRFGTIHCWQWNTAWGWLVRRRWSPTVYFWEIVLIDLGTIFFFEKFVGATFVYVTFYIQFSELCWIRCKWEGFSLRMRGKCFPSPWIFKNMNWKHWKQMNWTTK